MNVHFAAPGAQTTTCARDSKGRYVQSADGRLRRNSKTRLDMEGQIIEIEMLWKLLGPAVEDCLDTSPIFRRSNAVDGYHMMLTDDAELLDFQLRKLGTMIDRLVALNRRQ